MFALSAYAQKPDTATRPAHTLPERVSILEQNNFEAGRHLRDYTRGFYSGFAFQAAGGALMVVGLTNKNDKDPSEGRTITYVGIGLTAVGAIIQLLSHAQIGRAGRYLSGEGIAIPLN